MMGDDDAATPPCHTNKAKVTMILQLHRRSHIAPGFCFEQAEVYPYFHILRGLSKLRPEYKKFIATPCAPSDSVLRIAMGEGPRRREVRKVEAA